MSQTEEKPVTWTTPPEALEWTVHPFMESRSKAALSILVPLAMGLLIQLLLNSWFQTCLGLVLLVAAEFPFFLRATYRFDADGASMRRAGATVSKRWDQLKSYYPDRNGVLLSPFARPYWLENFRGIYLQYGSHRYKVLEYLKARLGPPPEPVKKR